MSIAFLFTLIIRNLSIGASSYDEAAKDENEEKEAEYKTVIQNGRSRFARVTATQ